MPTPNRQHNWLIRVFTTPIARVLAGGSLLMLAAAAVGWATPPTFGGLGPTIFWLGLLTAPLAFASAVVMVWLLGRHAGLQPALRTVGSSALGSLLITLLVLSTLELQYQSSHPLPPLQLSSKDPMIYLQRPDPDLGWRGARDYSRTMDFLSGPHLFATNSRGFRDLEQEPDPERARVVIIGDSFPLGWGADVEESITPALRRAAPETQFFNASWQGYGKDQIAWSYQKLARPLRPQVVLMMFMCEPFRDTSQPLYHGLRKPYQVLEGDQLRLIGAPARPLQDAASNLIYRRHWHAARIDGPGAAWRFLSREFPWEHSAFARRVITTLDWRQANAQGLPPIDRIEAKILAHLLQQTKADGAHLIVVPAPRRSLFQHTDDPHRAMQRHLRGYRQLGIETLDITPLLLDDWRRCYNLDAHPNNLAIERIQGLLSRRIRAALGGG